MNRAEVIQNCLIEEKTRNHPCFNGGCQNARIHLPIAPACNVSCNYCSRKYDCVNESRPGVTSEILNPDQALAKFLQAKRRIDNLKVVGIAGPGDALANFAATKTTLQLIRQADPDITFCLSTNGLMLPIYADELAMLGVSHVTVTINTMNPQIGAQIYREVNFMGNRLSGIRGASILLDNQLAGLRHLQTLGIVCKVNVVMIKGINDQHIEELIERLPDYGVFISNIMPLIPAPGSAFENMPLTSNVELNQLRKKCELHLKQMYHCRQCRADAIGPLGQDCSAEFRRISLTDRPSVEISQDEFPYTLAVASQNGKLIDEHFGRARAFYIYRYENGQLRLKEKRSPRVVSRETNEDVNEEKSLSAVLETVKDCDAVLVMRVGQLPQKIMEARGQKVIQSYGEIESQIYKMITDMKDNNLLRKSADRTLLAENGERA